MSTPGAQGLTIVCEWALVGSTSLNTLISTRVWRQVFTGATPFKHDSKAILIRALTTSGHLTAGVFENRYSITSYGATTRFQEAEEVDRAVYDRFQNAAGDVATGGIVIAEQESSTPTIEPDTEYPVVVSTWFIKTA